MSKNAPLDRVWWKEAIVYQIYPRSYQDSNGDGIGDLRGIINRLDYIASLGIDVVWLNPCYASPNKDNGYDIADYREIMTEFGDMADFDELLAGFHARGIKVVMDLVVNHTSDQHKWFKQSRSSRDNPYRDYYHWWPAENGEPPARWSYFGKDGSAWRYDATTDAYYLHYFAAEQPDLNWENPAVRREVYDMMHFWFKKGIDGFRMDVVTFISKDTTWPELEKEFPGDKMIDVYASGPRLHEYLHEMNREVLQHYDIMTVAEGPGLHPHNILDIVDEDRQELNMAYHFDHSNMGVGSRMVVTPDYNNLVMLKQVLSEWDEALAEKGWGTVYFGNHDFPRMLTRWGNDAPEHREASSKLLTTFLLSMRGTPYYYQGDEIGMSNIKFDTIEEYDDLMAINWYHLTAAEGGDLDKFLASQKIMSRDNARTPVQWDASANAGFTDGTPWLTVNANYSQVNVAAQEDDPDSVLNYFRSMAKLRQQSDVLIYGDYELLLADHPQLYVFTRRLGDEAALVVLNWGNDENGFDIPSEFANAAVAINNMPVLAREGDRLTLAPWQAVLLFN